MEKAWNSKEYSIQYLNGSPFKFSRKSGYINFWSVLSSIEAADCTCKLIWKENLKLSASPLRRDCFEKHISLGAVGEEPPHKSKLSSMQEYTQCTHGAYFIFLYLVWLSVSTDWFYQSVSWSHLRLLSFFFPQHLRADKLSSRVQILYILCFPYNQSYYSVSAQKEKFRLGSWVRLKSFSNLSDAKITTAVSRAALILLKQW